jgi:hypothetical protein
MRAWWEAYRDRWARRWRRWTARRYTWSFTAPSGVYKARSYPKIVVEYDDGHALLEGGKVPEQRDCGHVSRSFAYDPLREETVCIECYRRTVGTRRRA